MEDLKNLGKIYVKRRVAAGISCARPVVFVTSLGYCPVPHRKKLRDFCSRSYGRISKYNSNGGAFSRCAFQIQRGIMISRGVFDNGKSQSGAAGCFGVALVHPVKALENTALMLCRDTDTRIADSQPVFLNVNADAAAGNIILDRIVAEIVNDLIQQPPNTG